MNEYSQRIFPKRLSDLWAGCADGEIDLLSDTSLYLNQYRLNQTAAFIWQLSDGTHSSWDIAFKLYNACNRTLSLEVIVSDVNFLLEDLRKSKLIDWKSVEEMDVLLIAPPFPSTYELRVANTPEYSAPPLGLTYIAAVLRLEGYSVAIKDLHLQGLPPEAIIETCRALKPKVVGITATTPTFPNALRTARYIKAWNPDTFVVLGGVHAAGLPGECLTSRVFDYLVIGEGEITMLELTRCLIHGEGKLENIMGLAYLSPDSEIVFTSPRIPISDLDILPLPARDLIDLKQYCKRGAISTSRGCPMGCMFCSCNLIFGRQYRTLSVPGVLKEIDILFHEYGISEIDFNDDTFNWHPERVFSLCRSLIDRKLFIRWSCFCRAAQMTSEMAEIMKQAGCAAVQFGVESGSAQLLEVMGKNTTLREIEDAVIAVSKSGIEEIVCGIILGHPQDTPETIRDTLDYADHLLKIGATRIMLSLLTPYPGTQAFKEAENLGLKLLTKDWEQFIFSRVVVETKNLNKDTIRELYVKGLIRFLEHEKGKNS